MSLARFHPKGMTNLGRLSVVCLSGNFGARQHFALHVSSLMSPQVVVDSSNSDSAVLHLLGNFRCARLLADSCRLFLRSLRSHNAKTDSVSAL